MSLSFMQSGESQGAVCYILYGSHPEDLRQASDLQKITDTSDPGKVVLVDKNSNDGARIIEFYGLSDLRTPITLVVREDDTLGYEWTATMPAPEDVLYQLHQIDG